MLVSQSCPNSLTPHGLQPARLLCPWNSPGKNTEAGSHFLLQGIFLIQGLNPGLLHCRQILYHLSHQGNGDHMGILNKEKKKPQTCLQMDELQFSLVQLLSRVRLFVTP